MKIKKLLLVALKKIVSVTTSYAILNRIPFMFVKLLCSHIYFYVYEIPSSYLNRQDI